MPLSKLPFVSGFRVAVVEDDALLADNVATLLSGLPGVSVNVCPDGAAARALVEGTVIDLAVITARLPDGSGVAVGAELRRVDPDTEIIFISGDASFETAVAAVRTGAVGYLQKPYRPEDLRTLVARALAQIAQRRDRERLRHEVARSEALYRGVVDGVSAFVAVLSADGVINMCNQHGAQMLDAEVSALPGTRLEARFAGDAARSAFERLVAAAMAGRQTAEVELLLVNRRLLRVRASRFVLSVGAEPGVLLLGEDMTERRRLERRAIEAEALASVGQLTAGLAHEIRNPLNAASLQLELIRRGLGKLAAGGERLVGKVDVVKEELSRLTALLNDFLSLARPRGLARKPVSLEALFNRVIELQHAAADEVGVRLVAEVAPGVDGVAGDEDALKQVLNNLLVNAIEATGEPGSGGGEVRLEAKPAGTGHVAVTVSDDGPGIDPDVADRLFEPFVTSKAAGTGLGLTMVRRIVERHGGSIAASREGGTTVVRFTLERGAPG